MSGQSGKYWHGIKCVRLPPRDVCVPVCARLRAPVLLVECFPNRFIMSGPARRPVPLEGRIHQPGQDDAELEVQFVAPNFMLWRAAVTLALVVFGFAFRRGVFRLVQAVRHVSPTRARLATRGLRKRLDDVLFGTFRRLNRWVSSSDDNVASSKVHGEKIRPARGSSEVRIDVSQKVLPGLDKRLEWKKDWVITPRQSLDAPVKLGISGQSCSSISTHAQKRDNLAADVDQVEELRELPVENGHKLEHPFFPGNRALHENAILTDPEDIRWIVQQTPKARKNESWVLLYSTARDGVSLHTLYRMCRTASGPALTLIRDADDDIFGSFTSEPWRKEKIGKNYGNGEAFVFTVLPKRACFRWTKNNYLFQSGSSTSLSIGGGSHFALWIDEALQNGTSGFCETFNSQRLSSEASFRIRAVEVWGFVANSRASIDAIQSRGTGHLVGENTLRK